MKKDSALGRKAQSGLRQGASEKARTVRRGYRWGSDRPVRRKPLCEHAVLHRAGVAHGVALTAEPKRSLI